MTAEREKHIRSAAQMATERVRAQRGWPRWLRRGPMEWVATGIIATGVFMLLQPFWLILYTWSFVTTLAGTLLFTAVSKFPE
jgi:VIT1/CCC1 family predicted Fe2+/Mn2+ transporter